MQPQGIMTSDKFTASPTPMVVRSQPKLFGSSGVPLTVAESTPAISTAANTSCVSSHITIQDWPSQGDGIEAHGIWRISAFQILIAMIITIFSKGSPGAVHIHFHHCVGSQKRVPGRVRVKTNISGALWTTIPKFRIAFARPDLNVTGLVDKTHASARPKAGSPLAYTTHSLLFNCAWAVDDVPTKAPKASTIPAKTLSMPFFPNAIVLSFINFSFPKSSRRLRVT